MQISSDGGATWGTVGDYSPDRTDEDLSHTYYQTTIAVPNIFLETYAQSYAARAWASNSYVDPGTTAAVESNVLTVAAIGVPSAMSATLAISAVVPRVDPTSGWQYWEQTVTVDTAGNDPNCAWYFVTVMNCDSSGNPGPAGVPSSNYPIATERQWQTCGNDGEQHVFGPLQGGYLPTADSHESTRYRVYGVSRTAASPVYSVSAASWSGGVATLTIGAHLFESGQTAYVLGVSPTGYNGIVTLSDVGANTISFQLSVNPGSYSSGGAVYYPGWLDPTYSVLQEWPGGASQIIEYYGPQPTGAIPASNITGGIVASNIASVNASVINGNINASNIGSVNASSIVGDINASNIGSVNASSIVGDINASNIGSVAASQITGTINASNIGTINASQVTGAILSSAIGTINASQITGIIAASNIGAVAASQISGLITASNISSISASQISGLILASQINSINATQVAGLLFASQIGSVNASAIVGAILASQINSINASQIAGAIAASSIGSVNASQITGTVAGSNIGTINASQVTGIVVSSYIGSVNASQITGTISASNIGTINASQVTGIVLASYLGAISASQITGVIAASSIGGVTASEIIGPIQASNLTSVQASAIVGSILAVNLPSLAASAITGLIVASNIGAVNASQIVGSIQASNLTSVQASAIVGSISIGNLPTLEASAITGIIAASSIGGVAASQIIGSIQASNLTSVQASAIVGSISVVNLPTLEASAIVGAINASNIGTINASQIVGAVTASFIGSVNASQIVGAINASNIGTISASQITGSIVASNIGGIYASTINGVIVTSQLAAGIIDSVSLLSANILGQGLIISGSTIVANTSPSGNMLSDPSFENGGSVWSASGGGPTASTAYAGSCSWALPAAASAYVSQSVPVTPGQSYNLSAYVKVDPGVVANVVLAYYIAGLGLINVQSVAASTSWQVVEGNTDLVPAGASSLLFEVFVAPTPTGSGNLYIDACSMIPTVAAQAITSVYASTINGFIVANQISSVSASTINGYVQASQIGGVYASAISGAISASNIGGVYASTISGSIAASNIGGVYASTISGAITISQMATGGGINLLNNPGFELGSLYWAFSSGASISSSVYFSGAQSSAVLDANNQNIAQLVPVAVGQQYALSTYVLGGAGVSCEVGLLYRGLSSSLVDLTGPMVIQATAATTSWQQLQGLTSPIPAGVANLLFVPYVADGPGTGLVYFDTCSCSQAVTSEQVVSINAGTISGSIAASQIAGVYASAISGSIAASNIGGVYASTISGAIAASNIGGVYASTISGAISATNLPTLQASAISGAIAASNIGGVYASTISGAISATNLPTLQASAISGSISASNIGTIQASSISGFIGASLINSITTSVIAGSISIGGGMTFSSDVVLGRSGGGSVSITWGSGIWVYSVAGSTSSPYVNVDGAGITIASSFGGVNNYSVNITSTAMQMMYNGTAYLTLNSAGISLINGTIVTPSISGGSMSGTTLTLSATSAGETKTITLNPAANFSTPISVQSNVTGNPYATMDPRTGFTVWNGIQFGQLLYNQLAFPGGQVLTVRQTGLGSPSGFADSVAQSWCQQLYTRLSTHGLIT